MLQEDQPRHAVAVDQRLLVENLLLFDDPARGAVERLVGQFVRGQAMLAVEIGDEFEAQLFVLQPRARAIGVEPAEQFL